MFSQIVSALKIPPGRERITNQEALRFTYDYWRQRVIFSMIVGYAIFYFCRKNIAFSNPLIREDLDISATSLGLILTAHSVIYGFSKFFSGILADRSNARYFMAIGLFFSALMNIGFGFSSGVLFFAVFWIANGIFQGSGVPPCSRMLTMWFSKRESGTYWGIWNASHQLGGAGISLLASYLVATGYGWRSTFFVP
ncbi:MAG: MFS transporter, partial [Leptospiraceae bacterium]|nr:MFS transporter [Leptospiraceae bacterium]